MKSSQSLAKADPGDARRSPIMAGRLGRFILLALGVGACAQSLSSCTHEVEVLPVVCGLEPVRFEEFDELSVGVNEIGPNRWTAHTPWNGDFGDARFVDPSSDGPFEVRDGMLRITASKNENGEWESGLLAAADPQGRAWGAHYGYFEARMKFPPGKGLWPAFWLSELSPEDLQPYDSSRGNVEIDIVEYYGHDTEKFHSVIHIWFDDEEKKRGEGTVTSVPNLSLVEDFHTYGADVSPEQIVYFFDGEPIWSQPTPPELDSMLFPLVNLALGPGWPIDETPDPSIMLVDYVHVYSREGGPPEDCAPGPPHQQAISSTE